jgi:hypothetical protein
MKNPSVVIAAVRTPELLFVIAVLALYAALLWFLNRRFLKRLDLVFSRHSSDEPDIADIKRALDELNLDSAHFVFTMDRHANILLRQKAITLVYGHVGTRSPGGLRGPVWTLSKTVYALVDNGGAEWMKNNSDIFRPALSGYDHSIFWVNLNALSAC